VEECYIMKILIADDDKSIRILVAHMLEKIGVQEVIQAANGNEALNHWENGAFDLVVIDWDMPGRSGVDVVRAIRASGSRVPILMVTVRAERSQVLEAIGAGVSDFLSKPIEAKTLYGKLSRFCEHVDSLKDFKQRTGESTRTEYLNPFITSIISLFDTMLDVKIKRGAPFISSNPLPEHEVSGIIGLTGKAKGAAVVSLGRETALRCTERLLGERPAGINSDVVDAVGELANIVAGGAKAQLRQLNMNLGLPSVITGKDHTIGFPSNLTPVCIPFECEWGPISLQVGLKDQAEELTAVGCGAHQNVS
jgi:CheY-specific phosphatase CheX